MSEADLDLDGSWAIGGKIPGGYLLSVIARATLPSAPEDARHPITVSATILSAPDAGAASLSVETLRTGRSVSSLRCRLVQDGRVRSGVLLTARTLAPGGEPVWTAPQGAPDLPPVNDCPRVPALR